MLKRRFVDLDHGQVHLREGGSGFPLLMLHASPGSAQQLVPFASTLTKAHRVIAPDTPGNGDSVTLPQVAPTIADYARALPPLLDILGVEQVDVYGSHTGAAIAAELALLAPARVRSIIFDGIGVFTPEQQADYLANYAHPFPPDLDAAYLMRAFHFCRDQYMFFPWYDRTPKARLASGLGSPKDFHDWFVEVLKAAETYHLAYHAAFSWDAVNRLPQIAHPTLVMASEYDPLFDCSREAAALVPAASYLPLPSDADFTMVRTNAISDFLSGLE